MAGINCLFTIVAHVNLKQENIPFKSLIAQVILDVSGYIMNTYTHINWHCCLEKQKDQECGEQDECDW